MTLGLVWLSTSPATRYPTSFCQHLPPVKVLGLLQLTELPCKWEIICGIPGYPNFVTKYSSLNQLHTQFLPCQNACTDKEGLASAPFILFAELCSTSLHHPLAGVHSKRPVVTLKRVSGLIFTGNHLIYQETCWVTSVQNLDPVLEILACCEGKTCCQV